VANDDDLAAAIEAASGRHVVHRDTLGEMVCALVAVERKLNMMLMGQASYWTNRYARGWGGDRLYLLGERSSEGALDLSRPGVVWVTAWDTEKDRQEFAGMLRRSRGSRPGFSVVEDGRVAVVVFGACGGVDPEAVLRTARFQQDGRPWLRNAR